MAVERGRDARGEWIVRRRRRQAGVAQPGRCLGGYPAPPPCAPAVGGSSSHAGYGPETAKSVCSAWLSESIDSLRWSPSATVASTTHSWLLPERMYTALSDIG